MKLEFYNCPKPAEFPSQDSRFRGNDSGVVLPETPEFVKYRPDFGLMKKLAGEYAKYQNILILAHGGSITSFYGFYNTLKQRQKNRRTF